MGKVFVNVIGQWQAGLKEPLWVTPALAPGSSVTNLPAEQGLSFYEQRMKIEEPFKDLKSLLGMDKLMCQKRHWMEQMVCLTFIALAIGLVLGETLVRADLRGSILLLERFLYYRHHQRRRNDKWQL